ncbi:MAG TPA: glycerol-3-phosphate dehydrogenase C-terminal domain-containing protein, partial [Deltaproteobacteria bacterium]|nr:glycerol-3-phosphate dehydrogenase C-terminal domain-containing protein [Deltaproteobacteria bacterium]
AASDTYGASRRDEIYDNATDGLEGLITVEGGKFTTSRSLAQAAVDLVEKKLKRRRSASPTARRYLWGSQIPDMKTFMLDLIRKNRDFAPTTLEYLGRNYGTEHQGVLDLARGERALRETVNHDGEIMAQAVYAVRNEMARKLSDIVLRRTGIATLGNPGERVLEEVAVAAGRELGWDGRRIERELKETVKTLEVPTE